MWNHALVNTYKNFNFHQTFFLKNLDTLKIIIELRCINTAYIFIYLFKLKKIKKKQQKTN